MIDAYFKQYFWTFRLATLAAAAFLVARTGNIYVAAALTPPPEAIAEHTARATERNRADPATLVALSSFLDRNVFHAAREDLVAEEKKREEQKEKEGEHGVFDENDCGKSPLQATLLATVVSQDPESSLALVSDTRKQESVALRKGDSLQDEGTVEKIEWRRILLRSHGRCEFLSLDEESAPTRPMLASTAPEGAPPEGGDLGKGIVRTANGAEIPRAEIDNILGNLNSIATQARIVPNFANGKANGFKVFAVQPNSLYSKIGIENNDVIQRINGYEMNSPDKALEIYSKLKDASAITVDLLRNGKSQTMSYQIR